MMLQMRGSSLYRPNMAVGTRRWEVPLGLPVGIGLSQTKVVPFLGLGLVPLVSPNSNWDCVPVGQPKDTTSFVTNIYVHARKSRMLMILP